MKGVFMIRNLLAGFALLSLLAISAGCRAQIPPSAAPSVQLSWTAPSGCTTAAPCTYAISRANPINGTCPAATGTAYGIVGNSASQTTTYNDSSPIGGASYCYIAQTQQGTNPVLTSVPSNTVLLAVPTVPGAPSVLGGTSTASLAPEKMIPSPEPTMAKNEPLRLTARRIQ